MESLGTLEKRVVALIDGMKKLQIENGRLRDELTELRRQAETFEHSLLARDQHAEERSRELARAKVTVDELIRTIDMVVGPDGSHDVLNLESRS